MRPKEYRRGRNAATRCSGECPHTWPELTSPASRFATTTYTSRVLIFGCCESIWFCICLIVHMQLYSYFTYVFVYQYCSTIVAILNYLDRRFAIMKMMHYSLHYVMRNSKTHLNDPFSFFVPNFIRSRTDDKIPRRYVVSFLLRIAFGRLIAA